MSRGHRVGAVIGLVLCATAVLTWAAGSATPRHTAGLGTSLALGLVLAWAGQLQVHVRHRGTTEASDMFDPVLAVCAVAFAAPVLVPVALAAKAVSQLLQRVEPQKALFNVLTAGATAAAMALVLQEAAGLPLMGALALAQLASWVVNHLALLAVLSAVGVVREVLRTGAVRRWAVQGVVSGVLGLLLALAWAQSPMAVVLFVVPLAALHHAGRALSRASAERRRLAGTAAASRVLSSGGVADLPAYLENVRAAFGAQAAFLQTPVEHGTPLVVGGPLGAPVRRWLADLQDVLPAEEPQRLRVELPDKAEVLAVRLPDLDGVLAVVDPRGERDSGSAELATVSAAARELGAFLAAQRVRDLAAQEHERLEVVISSVADGIVTVGTDGRLVSFNAAAADITGLCPDQALGESVDLLALSKPDGTAWDPLEEGARRERARVRLLLRDAQGYPRHVDVARSPAVVDGEDCVVLVLRDVTASVEQERARQRFVIGLGHELRTPLTPLLGWARTLRRRPDLLDGPQRALVVEALDTESARLARLVDNLLTAVDPSSILAQRRAVDLADLVQGQLRARGDLHGRTVTVVAEGRTTVTTNARAVAQVVDNLLANVARYTPSGSPLTIRIAVEDGAALLEVSDSGPGVPEDQREAIFGLFVRGDGEAANPGVGMGLAVSRGLARSLGGDLVCLPHRGGARFRLQLPAAVTPRPRESAVAAQLFGT